MLVVSDATPVNILVRLGYIHVLPRVFGRVIVPPAVIAELTDEGASEILRDWATHLPDWVTVVAPTLPVPDHGLGPGETEALALAVELAADKVLIDEYRARRLAVKMGLTVTGTLGILETSHVAGLLDLSVAVRALLQTDFRISVPLVNDLLRRNNLPPLP